MKAKIQKWGNSLAVRIPKSFAVQTKIEQDTTVDLTLVGGKIIVEPEKKKPLFTLEELLSEISEENIHSETDWGEPVGKEIL
ncbi:MAG: AbrB/MazE/SpoVT family DNA-binding domain-containing protein [Acidobacteriota bacterium]|jgi:antitoxin MazE|nr:AbrB/MazE/SpoVT family DNA-binding domain-containing protein [Acidobacteriota bacterium]